MKVILLDAVRGVGRRHDIVEVAAGFANNFLIPQKKAMFASKDATAQIEELKASQAAVVAAEQKEMKAAFGLLNGSTLSIELDTNEQGGLYKTFSVDDIADLIAEEKDITLNTAYIFVASSIKSVGSHPVNLDYDDVTKASFILSVTSSNAEFNEAEKKVEEKKEEDAEETEEVEEVKEVEASEESAE